MLVQVYSKVIHLYILYIHTYIHTYVWAFIVAQMVKNLPALQTRVGSLGWEDLLEKGMATHSSILPGELQGQRILEGYSPWGSQKVGHNWVTNIFNFHTYVCVCVCVCVCVYTHTHTHIYFFRFFSIIVYYKMLNTFPWVTQ